MLSLLYIFGGSFLVALTGAMMPGPVLTVTISESSRRGAWAGPLLMIGHALLELALIGFASAGAFLNLALFDLYWALVAMTIILRVFVREALRQPEPADQLVVTPAPQPQRPFGTNPLPLPGRGAGGGMSGHLIAKS